MGDKIFTEVRCIHDSDTNTIFASVPDLIDLLKDIADNLSEKGLTDHASGVAGVGLGLLDSMEAWYNNPVNAMVIEFFRNNN